MPDPAVLPDASPVLGLPYIQPAQAQKHVTHNEALRLLDAVVQLAVLDRDRTAPPADPAPGDRHIVAAGATLAWAGQAGRVALWEGPGQGWAFLEARPGWRAWVLAEAAVAVFDGTAWAGPEAQALRVDRLGIGTPADAVNRLAVAAPAVLLTHAGAGVQVKANKAAAAETASLLFQTGFSGRAEMGTAGSDDFAVKVSADGAAWAEALVAEAATGRVRLPVGLRLPAGSAGTPALAFTVDAAAGLFRPAANTVALATGGAERLRATNAGVQVTGLLSGTAVTQNATDTTAGRVTRVGDFGLGATGAPPLLADLDDTGTAVGFWRTDATTANLPAAFAVATGTLVVQRTGAAVLGQDWQASEGAAGRPPEVWRRRYTAGAWTPWRRALDTHGLIAPVAQEAGVPTGGVFETGSGANGRFARRACGTMECWHVMTASSSAATTWTYPAAFVEPPVISATAVATVSAVAVLDAAPGTASATFSVRNTSGARRADPVHLHAIGRWSAMT